MELPYTIFALGDAQLHQLHTEAGKVRESSRKAFSPFRFTIEHQVLGKQKEKSPPRSFPVWT